MRKVTVRIANCTLLLSIWSHTCPANDYSYTNVTVSGAADTLVNDINNVGTYVGAYGAIDLTQPIDGSWNAFISVGGNVTTLVPPGSSAADANSVNNHGLVAGTYLIDNGTSQSLRGFTYNGTSFEDIVVPFAGAEDTSISNISDHGVIVGSYSGDFLGIELPTSFGFRATPNLQGGYDYESIDLGSNPAFINNTFLNARNTSGQEVATLREQGLDLSTFEIVDDIYGVLLTNNGANRVEVRYPDAGVTRLSKINNNGMITGTATFANEAAPDEFEFHDVGFIVNAAELLDGSPEDANFIRVVLPGDDCTYSQDVLGNVEPECHKSLQGINDRGTVVGVFDNDDAVFQGFVGTPSLPGDYNADGVVDAADYTVWRDNLSAPAGSLPNDIDGGVIGITQYQTWSLFFGETFSFGSSIGNIGTTIPEPIGILLLVPLAMFAFRSGRDWPR